MSSKSFAYPGPTAPSDCFADDASTAITVASPKTEPSGVNPEDEAGGNPSPGIRTPNLDLVPPRALGLPDAAGARTHDNAGRRL